MEKRMTEPVIIARYGYAVPLFNHWEGLTAGKEYKIMDELSPDKDCEYGYILIRDDRNYSIFYGKDNFKINQG